MKKLTWEQLMNAALDELGWVRMSDITKDHFIDGGDSVVKHKSVELKRIT